MFISFKTAEKEDDMEPFCNDYPSSKCTRPQSLSPCTTTTYNAATHDIPVTTPCSSKPRKNNQVPIPLCEESASKYNENTREQHFGKEDGTNWIR